jgi:D-lactate dehydrogenase
MLPQMKIAFFDAHPFEKPLFDLENEKHNFEINYINAKCTAETALLAKDAQVVCSFVNDKIDPACIEIFKDLGIGLIALRSAGFNHVDLASAKKNNIPVARVSSYSPHAVAEYTIGLLLSLNRKIHKSYLRVKELNFSLDGLVGFDLYGKTIGVMGTGKIGKIVAEILVAFGCEVLCFDKYPDATLIKNPRIKYVDYLELCQRSDVISLHIPLSPDTHHLLNEEIIFQMKKGVYIINTGRGALIDSKALIKGLKTGHVQGAALDVYEEEEEVFFQNLSDSFLEDDVLARLLSFPNVLISSHQAFLTKEALGNIAKTTLDNISEYQQTGTVCGDSLVKI